MDQITRYLKYSLTVLMNHGHYTMRPCLKRTDNLTALLGLERQKGQKFKVKQAQKRNTRIQTIKK
jgi:hypothetical protein